MTVTYDHLASLLFGRPHCVHPDKLVILIDAVADRTGIAFDPREAIEAAERIGMLPAGAQRSMLGPAKAKPPRSEKPFAVTDGVAIISISGTLTNRGKWIGSYSGLQSYEGLRFQLRSALNDDDVKAVLLDVDSGGGQAAGAFETGALVRELRAKKRVIAVVDDTMASAAYAIGSAASRVIITPSGMAGSIGVVMAHFDRSGQMDKAGVKPTMIFAGAKKVDGHPFAPLPDGVREDLQNELNSIYAAFVDTVAANRPSLSPAAIRATEAAMYIGQKAVDVGLVDAIGSFETALAELATGDQQPEARHGLAGVKPAAAIDPAVIAAIMALPEARGREDSARRIAEGGASVDTARIVLRSLPTSAEREAEQRRTAAEAAAAQQRAAKATSEKRQQEITASWDDVHAELARKMGLRK